MIFAAAYLIIYINLQGTGLVSIPYHTMEQCQHQAEAIENNNSIRGHAYCIEGSK